MTTARIFVLLACALTLPAQFHRKPKPEAPAAPVPFDYYVLSLSWAPDFCAQSGSAAANPKECATGRRTGFVVHGLWPSVLQGTNPESCGPAKSVSGSVVKAALPYMPSAGLIQHEWATHGTCTGSNPGDYFFAMIQARTQVQIPVQMNSIEVPVSESPAQIEAQFAAANPGAPRTAFRTACRNGALSEVRVCFNKDLKPAECPATLDDCSSPAVNIRPFR